MLVAALLPTVMLSATARAAGGNEHAAVAIFWQPPGARSFDAAARAAFADAVRPLGARLVDASAAAVAPPPPLLPALDAAKDEYARFKFGDAVAHLDQVQRLADARGGGDLDARQLSEIFLYRGLCRLETGADDAAWDDLVRAAELDPSRVMDPARFPPRAVAAFKRAAGEVARQAKLPLELDVPAGAAVHVDGAATTGAVTLGAGQHFVAVAAEGFEPWSGLVTVPAARDRFTPPLHAYAPPDADQWVALAGDAREILLGAVERKGSGWRFSARRITLPEGTFVADSTTLGELPVRVAVAGVMKRVLPPPPATSDKPKRRWIWWTVAGGAVAVAAVAVTLGVVLGSPAPSVSGAVNLP